MCRFTRSPLHWCLSESEAWVRVINLMITAITVEESTGGWLSEIHKAFEAQGGQRLNWAYTELCQCVQTLNECQMLEYSIAAQEQFLTLRQQRIRIGTQDLRIAAICLGNDLTLVTRNRRDFEQVPGLNLEDWSC
jgi:tRNA(fMet)-specific endonuclease VapC